RGGGGLSTSRPRSRAAPSSCRRNGRSGLYRRPSLFNAHLASSTLSDVRHYVPLHRSRRGDRHSVLSSLLVKPTPGHDAVASSRLRETPRVRIAVASDGRPRRRTCFTAEWPDICPQRSVVTGTRWSPGAIRAGSLPVLVHLGCGVDGQRGAEVGPSQRCRPRRSL